MTREEWLVAAPAIGAEVASEWGIELGTALEHDGFCSWIAPVGDDAILKVGWPHDEATHEADALAEWDGDGAVRLLRHDRSRWVMLLERCVPGRQLGVEFDGSTVELGCSLVRRLWREIDDGPYDTVPALTARWSSVAAERHERLDHGVDPGVVREGIALLAGLANDERFLLHQDLHPGNVLSSQREPWLVIDPKPVVGDRGFDLVRLVIDGVHDVRALRERLALVESLTGVDREHARRWALARCVDFALWHTDHGYDGDGGHAAAALLAASPG